MPRRCQHASCSKVPAYGVAGTETAEFCGDHKKEVMVNVRIRKRCAHGGCTTRPSYGTEATKTAEL